MGNEYLLGIDIGTQSAKVGIFDIYGNSNVVTTLEYSLKTPYPGWAEEDPEDWWKSVVHCIKESLKVSRISPDKIIVIGVSGQMHATVAVSKEGGLLSHSALLWCDKRSIPQCMKIRKAIDELEYAKITGNIVSTSWVGPHIMWIKDNFPHVYEKTYKFLTSEGYIIYKLTGKFTIDWSEASGTYLFDIRKMKWSEEIAQLLGIDLDKMPEIFKSYEVVGNVTEEAAKITGLKAGIPVVAGAGDFLCAALGVGCIAEGTSFIMTGTASDIAAFVRNPLITSNLLNLHHAIDGWVTYRTLEGVGALIKWFKDEIAIPEAEEARMRAISPYQAIDEKISEVRPGAEGLLVYPFPLGERPPGNANSRVVIFGLTLLHRREHIARAILEGIAFAEKEVLDEIEKHGIKVKIVRLANGGAKSVIWRRIRADIIGKPLAIPSTVDATLLGNIILAGIGVNIYKDPIKTVNDLVKIIDIVYPDEYKHKIYSKYYQIFRRFRETFWHLFNEIASVEEYKSK
jgi:xylulokinase